MSKTIRIGGGAGFWGETLLATPQLLRAAGLDYIIYDYLAEITMSIMARARAKNPQAGFATDFTAGVLAPHLPEIAAKGVKLVTNAGGVNPQACGAAAQTAIDKAGLDLKVAVVEGDDLLARVEEFAKAGVRDMFSGAAIPETERIASINAYLGGFPIARALAEGADIVIAGRAADSALALGICIHAFGWGEEEWDRLAAGSLVGHIIECGPQATGGNFTDWQKAGDITKIGYPVAEVSQDGSFICTKPEGTAGLVSRGTVGEQMLYEIGDPQAYLLPDVICDFSEVALEEIAPDRVRVSGAKGRARPEHYKICATYADGFRGGTYISFTGLDASAAAEKFTDAVIERAKTVLRATNLPDFTEVSRELVGAESQFGAFAEKTASREVVAKLAVRHPEAQGVGLFLRQIAGLGLSTPPGLSGFTGGGRASPSPVVRLFSFLWPAADIPLSLVCGGETIPLLQPAPAKEEVSPLPPAPPTPVTRGKDWVEVPLVKLAYGRSGDKGDKANIGIMARKPDYMPYIWAALDEESVRQRFTHFLEEGAVIERFMVAGLPAVNFLLDKILGGGGMASLRQDPQGKAFAQILLAAPIAVPPELAAILEKGAAA